MQLAKALFIRCWIAGEEDTHFPDFMCERGRRLFRLFQVSNPGGIIVFFRKKAKIDGYGICKSERIETVISKDKWMLISNGAWL